MTTSCPETEPRRRIDAVCAGLPDDIRSHVRRASELASPDPAAEERLVTTVAPLDRLLGGGLPRGALVELVGRGSCGRFAALLSALGAVTASGEAAALVDQGEQLDPGSAAALGIELKRLLWVRPRRLTESLAAAEALLDTGFGLVAVDLGLPPVRGRAPLAAWLRLARGCQIRRAVVLVGSPYRLSGCAATVVLKAGRGRGLWPGAAGTPRLLHGLRAHLDASRRRGEAPPAAVALELALPEASLGPEAPPATTDDERKVDHAQTL